ncbi:MAG: selenocysteine-specific translation elongation factor [Finegoldia sp.]|nr:selenocysteine-specific translation elongation factor [Finegoldia sp.]
MDFIIGTAGHIDHGKTTLIKALTGKNTDRLPEEQKRGISIDLGFSYFDLPSGTRAGIIDVPGHEKFVKNMMTGTFGMDLILLCIDCKESVKPQTKEHLDILRFLNINEGIVVLTKRELATDEEVESTREDVKDLIKGTFMENAPVIEVDSVTGLGIEDLKKLIDVESKNLSKSQADRDYRLNIDRAFNVKGIGTVVTGTLLDGDLKRGQSFLYPSEKDIIIKNIQVHGKDVNVAHPSQRVALNLNISLQDVERGFVVAKKGSLKAYNMIDVRIHLLEDAKPIEHWDRVRVFHGTKEIFGRVVPLDNYQIEPGSDALAQIRLEEKIYAKTSDSFIIRQFSPQITIGGGSIIDGSIKKHVLNDEEIIKSLKIKEEGKIQDIIMDYLVGENFPSSIDDLVFYSSESKEKIEEELKAMEEDGKVVRNSNKIMGREAYDKILGKIRMTVKSFHKNNEILPGISKEELLQKFQMEDDRAFFNKMIGDLVKGGDLKENDGIIAAGDHEVSLSDADKKLKDQMFAKITENGFDKLLKVENVVHNQKDKTILGILLQNDVVMLRDNFLIGKAYYDKFIDALDDHFKTNKTISIKELKDKLDISRKSGISLLETMDLKGYTKRIENDRVKVKDFK